MSGWREAWSLVTLLGEVDRAAPDRDRRSDGSIGDPDHASRHSDHNPWVRVGPVGIVRARDFTDDRRGGLDGAALADHLVELLLRGDHPALGPGAYVIWNRRILSTDRRHEGWRPYSGVNAHAHHVHLSVTTDPQGFDARQPWGWPEGDDMTPEDRAELAEELADAVWNRLVKLAGKDGEMRAGPMLAQIHNRVGGAGPVK